MTAARTSGSAGAHLLAWCADHQRGHIGYLTAGRSAVRSRACLRYRNHPVSSSWPSLVTGGLRNEAIAQRLFIAPGTVKVHLSHIFTKLGITAPAELAAQAASRT
jgi:hypothetical protein